MPKSKSKSAYGIAREYFPMKDRRFIEAIIWGQTGFPCFWKIPQDGATPEACFRKQLKKASEKYKKGTLSFNDGWKIPRENASYQDTGDD